VLLQNWQFEGVVLYIALAATGTVYNYTCVNCSVESVPCGWYEAKEPVAASTVGMGKSDDKMPDQRFGLYVMLPEVVICSHWYSFL
jgi:hypothetical protein